MVFVDSKRKCQELSMGPATTKVAENMVSISNMAQT